ncbi:S49 family peptidase [Labedaea rhizosphaerae]|uniref:Signal peptide peptidase SppA n=1 Tax=Labedaea rhizosphaerae TaxID=598644 RepID=A0A4R6SLJ1_LABRH|nr:S49 family peptidase [Labedaea rhizosphaerae]TDQ05088.1 signal peptide peptidase SppA [Labedaea rhizosphaerae]
MSVSKKLANLPGLGDRGDRKPVVAVVRLQGVITPTPSPLPRGTINAHSVESVLTRAFGRERLVAVALAVNSPGGAPTQSALVADRIRELAAEKNVPVLAFCEDVAASGGYWLACAADEIYAHSTSLVGSIGVVSSGFGLQGLIDRIGVERRVHTAGANKVRLDPFRPEKPEDVAWLESMQGKLHDLFVGWVRERRGDKLDTSADDLFTGEVWTGEEAKRLGLVDGIGTLREVVAKRFPEAEISIAEPRKPLLARLGLGGAAGMLMEAVENRALWSRFGL